MLYWLLVFFHVISGLLILQNTGIKRLFYYYLGILYTPAVISIIPQSMLMGHYFYVSMFIISMIRYKEFNMQNFMSCPLFNALLIVFISYLLIGIFDFRHSAALSIYRSIQYYCGTYFPFFIGWISLVDQNREYRPLGIIKGANGNCIEFLNFLLPFTLLMTLYGLMTAFTHSNPVLDAVGLKDRFLMESSVGFRSFRVTSTCVSSSVYGLACATLTLVSLFLLKEKTKIQIFAIGMLLLNVFLTATRAAIIPFLIGFIILIILFNGIKGLFRNILLGVVVLLLLFPLLPGGIKEYMYEMMDSIVDVISPSGTGGMKYGGSNIDARTMQITTAMEYLEKKPLFGHGFGYYGEVLSQGKKHVELLGMESYLCFIGVERGLVNFIAECMFYIYVFCYFYRNRNVYCKEYSEAGLSLLCMFIPFLVFAWVGGCWFYFMPILGYLVKAIEITKERTNLTI